MLRVCVTFKGINAFLLSFIFRIFDVVLGKNMSGSIGLTQHNQVNNKRINRREFMKRLSSDLVIIWMEKRLEAPYEKI